MTRTEYYDDPNAPKPNSMVVAASAVVTNEAGHILLQRRSDSGLWALPGGGMELTESLPDAAVREVKEETGLDIEITGLVGTYTDPRHIIAYSDGEVRRQFNICFTARITGGELAKAEEFGPAPWVATVKDHWVRLDVDEITGRHFVFGPEPEPHHPVG